MKTINDVVPFKYPRCSADTQKLLFDLGCRWREEGKTVMDNYCNYYLVVDADLTMGVYMGLNCYKDEIVPELSTKELYELLPAKSAKVKDGNYSQGHSLINSIIATRVCDETWQGVTAQIVDIMYSDIKDLDGRLDAVKRRLGDHVIDMDGRKHNA